MSLLMIRFVLVTLLLTGCAGGAAGIGDGDATRLDLQARLDRHLREETILWTAEPRMWQLLREMNARNAASTHAQVARLEAQWQREYQLAQGETRLIDTVSSRFASNYLAEVVLRMDGAYTRIILLDRHDLVVAASEAPERYRFSDEACVEKMHQHAASPWVQDRRPAAGFPVRVALPLREGEVIVGVLLVDIDVARLDDH